MGTEQKDQSGYRKDDKTAQLHFSWELELPGPQSHLFLREPGKLPPFLFLQSSAIRSEFM